jgi:tetratricopeptide (TPR) repeat protein
VWYGAVFVVGLVGAAVWTSQHEETRPIAFGLWWFVLTLLPTSAMALAEVANCQRPFLPLVGAAIAAAWLMRLWWSRMASPTRGFRVTTALALVLMACAAGVHARNEVWRNDETLWYDVTVKSPTNGRGLMNYALARMERGDYRTAIAYFQRAAIYSPSYSLVHTNLAIAYGAAARPADAEKEFQEGIKLAPADSRSHFYYGRWLQSVGRTVDAVATLDLAAALNPIDPSVQQELQRAISDQANSRDQIESAEHLLTLSLAAYQAGRFRECIARAEEALRLRPDYAEAYNNIAAAHNSLGEWDAGIAAGERAVELKPDFALARSNLAYARAQKLGKSVP